MTVLNLIEIIQLFLNFNFEVKKPYHPLYSPTGISAYLARLDLFSEEWMWTDC